MAVDVPAVLPVFPPGFPPLAANFNTWVQQNFIFLTQNVVLRVHQSSNQNYTDGVAAVIQFNAVDEDPYGGWDSGNFRWFPPADGWYQVMVFNTIQTQHVNLQTSVLVTAGKQRQSFSQHEVNGGFLGGGCVTGTVFCVGGVDYIQGRCLASGVNSANDNSSIGRWPRMEITLISQ